jgi:2-polyprenyl-3-methyl-5-hydroxy-6-metoxy-1,4-benzoquinol methylase
MSAYDADTWEGMERDMTGVYQANLLQRWIPAMPGVEDNLQRGIDVADVGCGSGQILILLAKAFPNSRFSGYDLFAPVIERAKANAETAGLAGRIQFETLDVREILPATFDLITTFEVVHDAADPLGLLRSIRRAMRAGGHYVCMDIHCSDKLEENTGPLAAMRYGASLLYCMSTSLANNGAGLGTMGLPESKMRQFCRQAGFGDVRRLPLKGIHSVYEVTA